MNRMLGDDRRGERGRGDQRGGALQARVIDRATGRIGSPRPPASARSASAARTVSLDQIPRGRDLAADVDAGRIERVDDGGQPEAEVAGGGLERRTAFASPRARARSGPRS